MSHMNELYCKTIELWRSGGSAGIRRALEYLMSFGMPEDEARKNLLGAIHVHQGTYEGGPHDPDANKRPLVH